MAEFLTEKFTTPIGVASYPWLVKPKAALQPGQTEKFDLNLILDPTEIGPLKMLVEKVATAAFGPSAMTLMAAGKLANPLKDGNLQMRKGADGVQVPDELYAGKYFITPRAEKQPLIIGPDNKTVLRPDAIYSGCFCRLMISIYAFPKPGKSIPNKGVALGLEAIQFARDGQRIGGGPVTAETAAAGFGVLPGAGGNTGYGA
jgi:hypothetical protein